MISFLFAGCFVKHHSTSHLRHTEKMSFVKVSDSEFMPLAATYQLCNRCNNPRPTSSGTKPSFEDVAKERPIITNELVSSDKLRISTTRPSTACACV